MRLVPLQHLYGGEIIAKDIFDENGNLLLAKNTKFKNFYRFKLEERGISRVYITDYFSEGIEVKDVIPDKIRVQSLKSIKDMVSLFKSTQKIKIEKIQNAAMEIVDSILENKELLYNVADLKTKDNYTYLHCINVSILCVMVGIKMGANREYLEKLAIGGILHDFGKLLIPDEILNKPDKLSNEEYEIIKRHTIIGYEILKESSMLTPISKVMILLHHERIDGSGYPLGVSKDNIHESARICAICDVFDAMTSTRVYKKAFSVVDTLSEMEEMTKNKLDADIFKVFRSIISYYPVGSTVLLNDNTIAIVEQNRPDYIDAPIVRVIFDLNTQQEVFKQVDLHIEKNLEIEKEIVLEEYIDNSCIIKAKEG
ncbi:HD-GYP domain-containing protein [Defluviitalea phaphyphila]|uniref:HD-GYP domain-containing protein n=1 Tax=Defluviitalea phaphyphila TaxID=1473580 RepID=UPI000730AF9C|nr:HD-GYP domain-containing protein [Defluviitalea phaphyphila]